MVKCVCWESGVVFGFISVNESVFWYMLVSAANLNAAICPPKMTFIRLFAEGKKQTKQIILIINVNKFCIIITNRTLLTNGVNGCRQNESPHS